MNNNAQAMHTIFICFVALYGHTLNAMDDEAHQHVVPCCHTPHACYAYHQMPPCCAARGTQPPVQVFVGQKQETLATSQTTHQADVTQRTAIAQEVDAKHNQPVNVTVPQSPSVANHLVEFFTSWRGLLVLGAGGVIYLIKKGKRTKLHWSRWGNDIPTATLTRSDRAHLSIKLIEDIQRCHQQANTLLDPRAPLRTFLVHIASERSQLMWDEKQARVLEIVGMHVQGVTGKRAHERRTALMKRLQFAEQLFRDWVAQRNMERIAATPTAAQ